MSLSRKQEEALTGSVVVLSPLMRSAVESYLVSPTCHQSTGGLSDISPDDGADSEVACSSVFDGAD